MWSLCTLSLLYTYSPRNKLRETTVLNYLRKVGRTCYYPHIIYHIHNNTLHISHVIVVILKLVTNVQLGTKHAIACYVRMAILVRNAKLQSGLGRVCSWSSGCSLQEQKKGHKQNITLWPSSITLHSTTTHNRSWDVGLGPMGLKTWHGLRPYYSIVQSLKCRRVPHWRAELRPPFMFFTYKLHLVLNLGAIIIYLMYILQS